MNENLVLFLAIAGIYGAFKLLFYVIDKALASTLRHYQQRLEQMKEEDRGD